MPRFKRFTDDFFADHAYIKYVLTESNSEARKIFGKCSDFQLNESRS